MPHHFNGEIEFRVAGSVLLPIFPDGEHETERRHVAPVQIDCLSPAERSICAKLGISEQDFSQMRDETIADQKELSR